MALIQKSNSQSLRILVEIIVGILICLNISGTASYDRPYASDYDAKPIQSDLPKSSTAKPSTTVKPNMVNFGQPDVRCPLPRKARKLLRIASDEQLSSGESSSSPRIIELNEINGGKVRIQFFYPNQPNTLTGSLRNSAEDFSSEVVTTTTTPTKMGDSSETTVDTFDGSAEYETETTTEILEKARTVIKNENDGSFDIMCQWQFLAGNSSQYLLLTFNKMSAPYSDDCKDAYVSLKKDDGYESRWCGNRRQGNGRPLALFSHSSAVVTVFRRRSAPESPPTGFSVTVEALENRAATANKTKDLFRILLRKMHD